MATSIRNKSKRRAAQQNTAQENALQSVIQNSALIERALMGRRLGMQYNGERDLYDAFGYPEVPSNTIYKNFFDRMGLATRAVEAFPDDTWGNPPILVDGQSRSDKEENQTPFITEWNALVSRVGLWQVIREADVLCGIGRWSVLFLGAPGDYKDPADDNGLAYMFAYDEPSAQPTTWVQDKASASYGMPETYSIMFQRSGEGSPAGDIGTGPVHFSRVIHISENRLGTRYTGRPRLQTVLNTLFDLEKIVGGAAEAVWLTLFKGIAIMAKEGTNLPGEGTAEAENLKKQLNALANRIQRYIALENVELKDLGVDEIRIRETFDIEIETLCAILKIPKRVLMGTERGELASSMDLISWSNTINTRQKFFAEPEILDPIVRWCIAHKVLPPPTSGKWKWEWESLYKPTPLEKSQIAANAASAADTISRGMGNTVINENEIRAFVDLPELKPEDLAQIDEQKAQEQEKASLMTIPAEFSADGKKQPALSGK